MSISKTIHVRAEPRCRELLVTSVAAIDAMPVEPVWPGLLYMGKLTILAGDPGLSKSTLAMDIAATISTGRCWPLSDVRAPVGDTLILAAEDDIADTVRPRLEVAGADLTRIHCVQGVFDNTTDSAGRPIEHAFQLTRHITELEEHLRRSCGKVRLVVIDPISAFLSGTDAHKNSDVRDALQPLVQLAQDHRIAVLLVSHLNKASETKAMYRISGSIAFAAVARTVLIVSRDPDEHDCRHLVVAKNNVGRDSGGLKYRVVGQPRDGYPEGLPRIEWIGRSEETAEDLVGIGSPRSRSRALRRSEAEEWLRGRLANGQASATEIEREASERGFAKNTLQAASDQLGVLKAPSGPRAPWVWSLPKKR
jgi:hypothetical protein